MSQSLFCISWSEMRGGALWLTKSDLSRRESRCIGRKQRRICISAPWPDRRPSDHCVITIQLLTRYWQVNKWTSIRGINRWNRVWSWISGRSSVIWPSVSDCLLEFFAVGANFLMLVRVTERERWICHQLEKCMVRNYKGVPACGRFYNPTIQLKGSQWWFQEQEKGYPFQVQKSIRHV